MGTIDKTKEQLTQEIESWRQRFAGIERWREELRSYVSHEVRSPLGSIRGFSSLILDGKVPDPEVQKEFLSLIDKESQRMERLINDLLKMILSLDTTEPEISRKTSLK